MKVEAVQLALATQSSNSSNVTPQSRTNHPRNSTTSKEAPSVTIVVNIWHGHTDGEVEGQGLAYGYKSASRLISKQILDSIRRKWHTKRRGGLAQCVCKSTFECLICGIQTKLEVCYCCAQAVTDNSHVW